MLRAFAEPNEDVIIVLLTMSIRPNFFASDIADTYQSFSNVTKM